jgi:hypothetical protein
MVIFINPNSGPTIGDVMDAFSSPPGRPGNSGCWTVVIVAAIIAITLFLMLPLAYVIWSNYVR